jgi:hypothetical protein
VSERGGGIQGKKRKRRKSTNINNRGSSSSPSAPSAIGNLQRYCIIYLVIFAMSDARSRSYETHFYCALCGGPFAQVFRTAVNPAQPSYAVGSEQDIYNSNTGDEDQDEDDRNEDLDIDNEFNISPHNNRCIPGEVVRNSMSHAASRSRELRLVAEEEGRRRGMVSEKRKTMQAYNGKHISTRQMKWTKNLRALIYKRSNHQPLNHEHYGTSTAYLTGRGLIRQVQNWADAFASVDEEGGDDNSGVHTEHPFFSDEDKQQNTYGFHVYQELGRPDSRYVISSIPFHDECWSLLDLAIEESGKERGVVGMNERFDMDELWGYLRGLVGVTGVIDSAIVPNSTAAALSEERRGSGVVSRLGEVDYREGQGSGDGWQWKHEEGLHVGFILFIFNFHLSSFPVKRIMLIQFIVACRRPIIDIGTTFTPLARR